MKKIIAIATLVAATSASAGFFNNGSNDFGPFNGSNMMGPFDSGSNMGPFTGGNNMGPLYGIYIRSQ